jgi:hypothetical protein
MSAMSLVEADAVANAANGNLSGTSRAVADALKAHAVLRNELWRKKTPGQTLDGINAAHADLLSHCRVTPS